MARIVTSIALIVAALVCGYLFLAGFERPGVTTWKVITGSLGVLFLLLSLLAARSRKQR